MAKKIEVVAKTVDEAIEEALQKLGIDLEDADVEIVEEGNKGVLGIFGAKGAKVIVTENIPDSRKLRSYLLSIFKALDITPRLDIRDDGETISADITGDNVGCLIGHHGDTLQAVNYIANLIINKDKETFKRVKIDVENYRKAREDYLVALAKRTADRVARYKRSISLDAMPASERRIIHSALQNHKVVTTISRGDEPNRYVVVLTKTEAAQIEAKEAAKAAKEAEFRAKEQEAEEE